MRVTTPVLLAALVLGANATAAMATPAFDSDHLTGPQSTPAGVAAIRCVLAEQGALTDCKVLSESPTGIGIGEQALKMAAQLKLPAGEPGRVVTIPLRFMLAPGQGAGLQTP